MTVWPRTLFGRVVLILFAGLAVAQGGAAALVLVERGAAMRAVMVPYVSADVASAVAMLDRLPVAERDGWLPRLQRDNYHLSLGAAALSPAAGPGPLVLIRAPADSPALPLAVPIADALSHALGRAVTVDPSPLPAMSLRFGLPLADGTAVAIDLVAPRLRLSPWIWSALAAQLLVLAGLAWFAVRQVTRPLAALARAASDSDPARPAVALAEDGPREVAEAAIAFNRMQHRIRRHFDERSQMLGAIAHDLKTPIARMCLRADLLDDADLRARLATDLAQMQHLVEQGLAYAQTAQAPTEAAVRSDLLAFLQSLVADRQDAGQPVSLVDIDKVTHLAPHPARPPALPDVGAQAGVLLDIRPRALRRIVDNLVDNALKFAGSAELALVRGDGKVSIEVRDRGPGIAPEVMALVTEPYYRVEGSRNRATGGTGLGLAIAQQLATHCGAELVLAARTGGGLVATLRFRDVAGSASGTTSRQP